MDPAIKQAIDDLGRTFEAFKIENDKQINELKTKGFVSGETLQKIERMNAALDNITAMKAQLEALDTAVGRISAAPGGAKTELERIKVQHREAFENWFRHGGESALAEVKKLQIQAGLSTLSDPDGGYLITPPEFDQQIARVAGTMSAMRRICTVRTIGTDTYKKLVNQGGAASGWVAEKQTRTETATPTLKEIAINMKEIYAEPGCTQISLDDSFIDLPSWLADEVSIEFTEQEGDAFINGNGVEKPHGIAGYTFITNASYTWGKIGYVPVGHASLLNNADKIEDLTLALKSIYLNGASFLMNRNTVGKIRQLKDGNGQSLWQPGLQAGAPNVLFGYPVDTDDNIAVVAANAYPIFFGNFKRAYLILDRMGIRVLRDPYTSKGNVLFYTTKRVGGGIIMYEAIKALKIATM